MESPMAGLKGAAEEIQRKLESGELDASSASRRPTPGAITNDWLTRASRLPQSERLSRAQKRRRVHVMRLIDRYRFDMKLEPLSKQMLKEDARSYDQQLTYAGAPTDRFNAIYLEAISTHPEGRFLNAVDFVGAWRRIQEAATERFESRAMSERGEDCSICKGKGMTIIYDPKSDADIEKECPYHCKVVVAMEKRS
jgi:hypothetical protein